MNRLREILVEIQTEFRAGARRFTDHAVEEATNDDLSVDDVVEAILHGDAEIVEDYPENTRGACCLVYGRTESGDPLHCVVSYPPDAAVITLYRPDPTKWVQYRKRKRQ